MERSTFSTLSGGDAAVALRSLARRFREHFRPGELAGDTVAANMARSPTGGGPSPLELVQSAQKALAAALRATEQVLTHDNPELDPNLLDRARRDRPAADGGGGGTPVTVALDGLVAAANTLADRSQHVSLKDWGRTGRVGDTTVTAIELLQEAVASGRTYLDQLGPVLDAVRRAPD